MIVPQMALLSPTPALVVRFAFTALIFYGGLGFLGIKLSQKLGSPDIWDTKISNRQRILIPAIVGVLIGIFFLLANVLFSRFHSLGAYSRMSFPVSFLASANAAIGEEIMVRLFFIPFLMWLIHHVILKGKWRNQVFWICVGISASAFVYLHVLWIMLQMGWRTIAAFPPAFLAEIIILNTVLSLFAAYYFRKFGFLASVGIHFWADVVWLVIRGIV
ncbi:MAG TPA: hypothetical protein ENH82_14095 [bacterium]|nr:hypothetical protein [bacterium]